MFRVSWARVDILGISTIYREDPDLHLSGLTEQWIVVSYYSTTRTVSKYLEWAGTVRGGDGSARISYRSRWRCHSLGRCLYLSDQREILTGAEISWRRYLVYKLSVKTNSENIYIEHNQSQDCGVFHYSFWILRQIEHYTLKLDMNYLFGIKLCGFILSIVNGQSAWLASTSEKQIIFISLKIQ